MLPKKRYRIPKYLYQRKILLIKAKILKRKYGYLFFRQAICKILPSEAIRHYQRNLKKTIMAAWIMLWYKERVEWKLIIKSDIHYKCNMLHRTFHLWRSYQIEKRSSKLKLQIAVLYSFQNDKRQVLLWTFNKWNIYKATQREKKRNYFIAKEHFRSKYNPYFLQSYFKRWIILSTSSLRDKFRMQKAITYFEHHLMHISFRKIFMYKNIQKIKTSYKKIYLAYYEKKLLKKIMNCWKIYIMVTYQEKQKNMLASNQYIFRLKQSTFHIIKLFARTNKNQKLQLVKLMKLQNKRLIRTTFVKFKLFGINKKIKRKNTKDAESFYSKNLLRKVLNVFRENAKTQKDENIKINDMVAKIKMQLRIAKMKFVFYKWKKYLSNSILKKRNKQIANAHFINQLLKHNMCAWKNFLQRNNYVRYKTGEMRHRVDLRILKKYLYIWKHNTEELSWSRSKLKNALHLHKCYLIEEGLLLLIKCGIVKKDQNFIRCRQISAKRLFLALKYFSLWKRNSLKFSMINVNKNILKSDSHTTITEWFPICFLAPRIFQNKTPL